MHQDPARDYVLRALSAAEIAESCTRADLRASFYALSEHWLEEAGQVAAADGGWADAGASEALGR
jgi:hypothetical protein